MNNIENKLIHKGPKEARAGDRKAGDTHLDRRPWGLYKHRQEREGGKGRVTQ